MRKKGKEILYKEKSVVHGEFSKNIGYFEEKSLIVI